MVASSDGGHQNVTMKETQEGLEAPPLLTQATTAKVNPIFRSASKKDWSEVAIFFPVN